jgi:hypothetical protein
VVRHAGGNRISLVLKLWPGCPVGERTRRFNRTLTGRAAKTAHAESGALDRAVLLVANEEALANFYDRVWPQSPGGFDRPEPALLAALCSGPRYLIHDQNGSPRWGGVAQSPDSFSGAAPSHLSEVPLRRHC